MLKNIHSRVREWNSWSLRILKEVRVGLIESVTFDCTDLKVVESKPCRSGEECSGRGSLSDNVHMFPGGMCGKGACAQGCLTGLVQVHVLTSVHV